MGVTPLERVNYAGALSSGTPGPPLKKHLIPTRSLGILPSLYKEPENVTSKNLDLYGLPLAFRKCMSRTSFVNRKLELTENLPCLCLSVVILTRASI